MPTRTQPSRFILMPTRGFTADHPFTSASTSTFLKSMRGGGRVALSTAARRGAPIEVLDSIHENGPKLVSISPEGVAALRAEHPGMRVVPEVFYPPALAPRPALLARVRAQAGRANLATHTVTVLLQDTAVGLADVTVLAFTDFARGVGAQGTTNSRGQVRLRLPASTRRIERLYLYPEHSAWPRLLKSVAIADSYWVRALDEGYDDSRAKCYPAPNLAHGAGVSVGVVDTGTGPHRALTLAGGRCTVLNENPADFADVHGHGTHVAGVIAARAARFRGLAPSATLRAYRVFGRDSDGASNFAIAKAIDLAVADGCDLINLSLGGGPSDALTDEAIKAARQQGVMCVIAAGNDGGAVSWPGRHQLALCVSAMGIRGTWPRDATQSGDVTRPYGKLDSFMARFSNRGIAVDLTGPGVGIVSTMPNDRYGVMDGTSMATPVVCGAIARALAADAAVRTMPRDGARADAIEGLARRLGRNLGFAATLQGNGLPR
jgi:subtilisin